MLVIDSVKLYWATLRTLICYSTLFMVSIGITPHLRRSNVRICSSGSKASIADPLIFANCPCTPLYSSLNSFLQPDTNDKSGRGLYRGILEDSTMFATQLCKLLAASTCGSEDMLRTLAKMNVSTKDPPAYWRIFWARHLGAAWVTQTLMSKNYNSTSILRQLVQVQEEFFAAWPSRAVLQTNAELHVSSIIHGVIWQIALGMNTSFLKFSHEVEDAGVAGNHIGHALGHAAFYITVGAQSHSVCRPLKHNSMEVTDLMLSLGEGLCLTVSARYSQACEDGLFHSFFVHNRRHVRYDEDWTSPCGRVRGSTGCFNMLIYNGIAEERWLRSGATRLPPVETCRKILQFTNRLSCITVMSQYFYPAFDELCHNGPGTCGFFYAKQTTGSSAMSSFNEFRNISCRQPSMLHWCYRFFDQAPPASHEHQEWFACIRGSVLASTRYRRDTSTCRSLLSSTSLNRSLAHASSQLCYLLSNDNGK